MERNEFLTALRERLQILPAEEADSALRYYEEYLDEAENEEEAIRSLGSPEQIAARILTDLEQQDAGQPAALAPSAEKDEKNISKRSPLKTALLIFLLICASPLLISLGAAALSIIIALLAVLLGVIVAVITPFIALSLSFIALFFVLLYWAGAIAGFFVPGTVLLSGLALIFGALGIVCSIFTGYLIKWTGQLLTALYRAVKPKKKKEVQPA